MKKKIKIKGSVYEVDESVYLKLIETKMNQTKIKINSTEISFTEIEEVKEEKPKAQSHYTIQELDEIFEKLKPKTEALNFPSLESQGWEKNESVTAHDEGKENHKVEAFKKRLKINGDIPEKYFSLEASYVFCPTCKKFLKKRIILFHERGGMAYHKDF